MLPRLQHLDAFHHGAAVVVAAFPGVGLGAVRRPVEHDGFEPLAVLPIHLVLLDPVGGLLKDVEILRLAREGGATLALSIEIAFTSLPLPQGGTSFAVAAAYSLARAESGAALREGKVQESGVDRRSLGLTIGKAQKRMSTEELRKYVADGVEGAGQ